MRDSQGLVLGIDFGTTNVSAAVLRHGRVEMVLDRGDPLIPNIVYVPERGEPQVGRAAAMLGWRDPERCLRSIKRLLGATIDDSAARVMQAGFGYRLQPGPNGIPLVVNGGIALAPTQIAGFLFEHVRSLAERRFGSRVVGAVVTVPADASAAYVAALRQAARFAHIEVRHVIAEPVAGALALGMQQEHTEREFVVCDFGGGTLDVTRVEQCGGRFRTIAVAGDSFLGGDDFDLAIAEGVAGAIYRGHRFDIHKDVVKWRELVWRCEAVKRALTTASGAPLKMPNAFISGGVYGELDVEIDRPWAEVRWQSLIERAANVLASAVSDQGGLANVERVLLIGGTTRVPLVQRSITELFGLPARYSQHAELAVTVGAAMQTADNAAVSTEVPRLGR